MEPDDPGRNPEQILGGSAVKFSSSEILPAAESTGFRAEMVEKVLHLLNLLNALNSHPFLKRKWALKGGTALNMFVLDLPRLSVDIDLNYIGALGREEMLTERPKIEQAAQAVFSREGFIIKKVPDEHAGGKWRLRYQGFTGQSGNLEVDLNFMFRQPLWDIHPADSHPLGNFQAKSIPVLDLHELASGKLAALLARGQARDLFDCHRILNIDDLERDRLRIAFVVYGGMNRKDWRTVSIEDLYFDAAELTRQLIPTLHVRAVQEQGSPAKYGAQLVTECKKALSVVLPLTDSEREFLDLLLDKGEIDSTILTADTALQERIQGQPLLEWKALNVRLHKGLT
ncbi:MAG: nucleotidyl transferase AbiEii/AbiGii toxin family protein [Deltaproteobacteria bacterium]|nr:nucleotidyl transferase AbiEii/AbiGii toxin family protein [Deltaproteobacteria bacterium]